MKNIISLIFLDRLLLDQPNGRDAQEVNNIRFLRLYRSLDLLIEEFNRALGMIYIGFHYGEMCIVMFCIYGAIRLNGILAIALGFIGSNLLAILTVLVSQLGQINHSSKGTLKALHKRPKMSYCMGKQGESKWLRREVMGLRELRVRMGSSFYYDKVLLLTTFQILLQNIVNLLLL